MSHHADYWLTRTYACLSVGVTAVIALTDKTSQHSFSFASDGAGGSIAIGVLLALAVIGLLDLILNDWLKALYCPRFLQNRFLLYMAMAGGQGSLLFANVSRWNVEPFLFRYVVDAAVAAAIGILLVGRRYKWWKDTTL